MSGAYPRATTNGLMLDKLNAVTVMFSLVSAMKVVPLTIPCELLNHAPKSK